MIDFPTCGHPCCNDLVSAAWERSVGGLPRRVCAMHGPWSRSAKMSLPLSREWISTTDYID